MIHAEDFDAEEAQEWALDNARTQGCTCHEEPEVFITNCENHGVHLGTHHEDTCQLAFFHHPKRNARIAVSDWN